MCTHLLPWPLFCIPCMPMFENSLYSTSFTFHSSDYESLQHLGNFRTRSSSSSDTVYSAPPLNHDPSHRMPSPQLGYGFASGHSESRAFQQAGTMEGDHVPVNSMAFLLEASTDYIKPSTNRRSKSKRLFDNHLCSKRLES